MRKSIYAIGVLLALTLGIGSGYFVVQHILWVHTFGWPILSTSGLWMFSAICLCSLFATILATGKLMAAWRKPPSASDGAMP